MMAYPLERTWIIAHRGARDEAPENTFSAFYRALDYPIDGIELDVQLSRDGGVVIYHDWTIYRLARRRRYLFDLSLEELRALNWGGWFHADFNGEAMPLLKTLLSRLGPQTRWFIEIKSHPAEQTSGRVRRLTETVLSLIGGCGHSFASDQIYILSFDPQVLLHAADLAPDWRYVLNLSDQARGPGKDYDFNSFQSLWAVDEQIGRLSSDLVQQAHHSGLQVFTYTCNTPRQVRKALELNVDAVLTDRPGWLCRFLQRV
jgi:glycerophosphoryl diester phosphodiesterase